MFSHLSASIGFRSFLPVPWKTISITRPTFYTAIPSPFIWATHFHKAPFWITPFAQHHPSCLHVTEWENHPTGKAGFGFPSQLSSQFPLTTLLIHPKRATFPILLNSKPQTSTPNALTPSLSENDFASPFTEKNWSHKPALLSASSPFPHISFYRAKVFFFSSVGTDL